MSIDLKKMADDSWEQMKMGHTRTSEPKVNLAWIKKSDGYDDRLSSEMDRFTNRVIKQNASAIDKIVSDALRMALDVDRINVHELAKLMSKEELPHISTDVFLICGHKFLAIETRSLTRFNERGLSEPKSIKYSFFPTMNVERGELKWVMEMINE